MDFIFNVACYSYVLMYTLSFKCTYVWNILKFCLILEIFWTKFAFENNRQNRLNYPYTFTGYNNINNT